MNRPLYIFLGWLIYKPLKLLGAEELIPNDMANLCFSEMKRAFTRAEMWINRYSARDIILAWGALILVNVVLFALSFYCFALVLINFTGSFGLTSFLLFLLFLDGSLSNKGFVWYPHTTIFDMFIPAVCAYFSFKCWGSEGKGFFFVSLLIGILMLGKGELFAGISFLLFYLLYRKPSLLEFLTGLVIFAIPVLTYALILKISGYRCLVWEVEKYKQGVWFMDFLKRGEMLSLSKELFHKTFSIVAGIFSSMRLGSFLMLILVIFASKKIAKLTPEPFIFLFSFVYLCIAFLFWIWVGYIPDRLMFTFYPALYLPLSKLLREVLKNEKVVNSYSRV